MHLNPETLAVDSEEEQRERQRRTGTIGTGLTVICTPDLAEPTITQVQHRAVCLGRPYPACQTCQHSSFVLLFRAEPQRRTETVLCPRWKSEAQRMAGQAPEAYEVAEIGTCEEKPFGFCPSCPSREELGEMAIDKRKDGWYSRWKRFKEDER